MSDRAEKIQALPTFVREKAAELEALCQQYQVKELYLFGSALRSDFNPEHSDLDWVVVFDPQMERKGFDDAYFKLMEELETLFGREIDLVEWHMIRNPYLKAVVSQERRQVYAA